MQLPFIPETIRVHLGPPGANAHVVTVPFSEYIKIVASKEIYPTWPDAAIVANIIAQITFALNRVYTEYYPSRGYNFDITNSTATDQSFDLNATVFENISQIVDNIFNSYIRYDDSLAPLFAQYCDGRVTQCEGLSQWGTVDRAQEGMQALDILKYYYGDNIIYETNVPVGGAVLGAPIRPLTLGTTNNHVRLAQQRLNRISVNYPSIPKIYVVDGTYGPRTEEAVREFQRIFNLPQDGIIGDATWYKILQVYNAVKRLNELVSEGLTLEEVQLPFPESIRLGDTGILVQYLQFYINFLADNLAYLSPVPRTGVFDEATDAQVKAIQRAYGLEPTGIVDYELYLIIHDEYMNIINSLPESMFQGRAILYPGYIIRAGFFGENVTRLQEYLAKIASVYGDVPAPPISGYFGPETQESVTRFQTIMGLPATGGADSITWEAIKNAYDDIMAAELSTQTGQFPGTDIGGETTTS